MSSVSQAGDGPEIRGFARRTQGQEHLVQDGTEEQMVWASITARHHASELYAHKVAKGMIGKLQVCALNDGPIKAMKLCRDTKLLTIWARLYEVGEGHIPLCVELVQRSFEARYKLA